MRVYLVEKLNSAAHSDTAAIASPRQGQKHLLPLAEGLADQAGHGPSCPGMKPFRRAICPPAPLLAPSCCTAHGGAGVSGTTFPSISYIIEDSLFFPFSRTGQDNLLVRGGSSHLCSQKLPSPAAKLRKFGQCFQWCC